MASKGLKHNVNVNMVMNKKGAPKLGAVAIAQRVFLIVGITVTVLGVLGLLLIHAC